ncbi:MAG: hypothetical protein ABI036_11950 [Fibrobacteria bacterium]
MLNRRGLVLTVISLLAFGYGVTRLFQDRLESGDIYPAYSSLRSDPLGCRAFYTALERYPELDVKRAFARTDFRGQAPGTVYFFLGLDGRYLEAQNGIFGEADSLARQGQRVVMSFIPMSMEKGDRVAMLRAGLLRSDSASAAADGAGDSTLTGKLEKLFQDSAGKEADKNAPAGEGNPLRILREWGVRLLIDSAFLPNDLDPSNTSDPESSAINYKIAVSQNGLGDTVPWISGLYFDSLSPPWEILYRRGALPVAVERAVGAGSVVLAADSYFASNQALFHTRPARMAAALVGGGRRIFFDERHLGVRQDDAVADLLRRYRLHWLLPSLLTLAGLYIWKARYHLSPEPEEQAQGSRAQDGRGALSGLLRRNLTHRQTLEACYGYWQEGRHMPAPAGSRGDPKGDAKPGPDPEIQSVLERRAGSADGNLAAGYSEIQAILNRRKRK